MTRSLGYLSLFVAVCATVGAVVIAAVGLIADTSVGGVELEPLVIRGLRLIAILATLGGTYVLLLQTLIRHTSKRRAHNVRNVLRLGFGALTVIAVFGVATEQWLGVLFSLGVIGFAITFALQQPLLSLLGWFYIMIKRPYGVGDRVQIEGSKGDVISVDFLVTTLWEINGDMISSNQPSGRVVTVPNSVVLSSQVINYGGGGSPFVWNELSMQVAYETDLEFAREEMIDVANAHLGDEMSQRIAEYREALAETPVELEVYDRPTVNVVQQELWVELKLRYVVHPRRGQRAKNQLYASILDRFNEYPDRVAFPVSRNR